MTRRVKTFEERRQELIGAIEVISQLLRLFEESGNISFLRSVAGQLRALIVYEPQSSNLRHPLLIELAKEANIPLVVFTIDQEVTDTFVYVLQPNDLRFFSTGDVVSLKQTPPYSVQTVLENVLEATHTIIGKEKLSMKQVIRLVADTEASHYDPSRPETLDNLDTVNIMGLPPEYRTIYSLGNVVRSLGYQVIQRTS